MASTNPVFPESLFDELIPQARAVRESAYAPYSRFAVGAALRAVDGRIFAGCNVENLSFGLTICAERAALFGAVAAGCREFTALAVVADSRDPVTPCGACRQVLAEFSPALPICSVNLDGEVFVESLAFLLPRPSAGILDSDSDCST